MLQARHPLDGAGKMLPSGQVVFPHVTDWIVTREGQIVDVCTTAQLVDRYEPIEDGLSIPRPLCTLIEATTGVGTTRSAVTLQKAIQRLATIQIGEITIPFTPGQLEEIKHRAAKRGWPVVQELQRIVDRIKDEIFYKS